MPSESEEISFSVAFDQIDLGILPANARELGSDDFREAITKYLTSQHQQLGGTTRIVVNDLQQRVDVTWRQSSQSKDLDQTAKELLRKGDLVNAVPFLEILVAKNPTEAQLCSNLGMALSELGQLNRAKQMLLKAISLSPSDVNSQVALGVLYTRAGDLKSAIDVLERCVKAEPSNVWARRNLGATLMNDGQFGDALPHLEEAVRLAQDEPAVILGLGQCLEALDRITDADEMYKRVMAITPHSSLGEMARSSRTKLAEKSFRRQDGGVGRPDAVMYLGDALERLETMSDIEIKQLGFEVAMLGSKGLDTNSAEKKYSLKAFDGKFSGLQIVCFMYASIQRIAPGQDIGFDLSKEYEIAQSLRS